MAGKLDAGTVFAHRYRIVRCMAEGGMGAVYEVVHLETERRRALKVMHPHLFQSDEMRGRFKREARIAAQVDSEYIVDVFDAGVDDATETPFLVMELLRGEELGDRLKRLGRLPLGEVVTYMQQTAAALDRTHAASIVHRDLKPENLFLTHREDGTPQIKILDFGVAKLVAEGATGAGATRSLGTPLYMAPEQFGTKTRLTGGADIYALTLMTYTLLVGEAYWLEEAQEAGNVFAFAMLVAKGPQQSAVERAASRGVTLPAGFDAWFIRGTAKSPKDRFPTASDAVRELREIEGEGGSEKASNPARPSRVSSPAESLGAERVISESSSAVERAATSTGAAMTPAPLDRRPRWLTGTGVALAMGLVGLGAWAAVRAMGANGAPSTPVIPTSTVAAAAAVSAPPIVEVPEVTAASALPSASTPPSPIPTGMASAGPSARAPSAAKPAPHPVAPAKGPQVGISKLIGRD